MLGYVISVTVGNKELKLRKGLPVNVRLDNEQCIVFPSYTEEKNLSIML